ncbi:MAG: peptidylprolyl isomerase [Candidatus Zixiibacteriota bacterium]
MKKNLFFLFLFLAFLLFLNCAKKEEKLIALVGDEKITADELDMMVKGRSRQMPSTRDEERVLKMRILDQLLEEKLLAQAAKEAGRDKDTSFVNTVRQQEEKFLLQTLYQVKVLDKTEPTERELKEFYKKQDEEIHPRHILLKSESKAQEVYNRLQEGADFEELATQESEDVATQSKGGDLGFIKWGKAVGPFQETAFSLQPQQISKPIKTSFGWHIIKLEERRTAELPDYENAKEELKTALRNFKQQDISYNLIEDMRRKSGFKVKSSILDILINKADKKEDTLKIPQTQDVEFNPAKYTPEEKELVLATFKGGELKLGQFLDYYQALPAFRRPGLDRQLLEDLVYQMCLKEILIKMAKDDKVDKSESYLIVLNDFKDMTLANGYRYDVLWKDISTTAEEIEEYYEKNKDLYLQPAGTNVKEIMVKTEEEAREVLKQVKGGADWDSLAKKTLRSHAKNRGGELGYVNEKIYPEIFGYAWNNMETGEIAGPIHIKQSRYGEGYSVIKLLDKKYPYQKKLSEVESDVQRKLIAEKKQQAMDNWISQQKEKKEVKIFEDVLETTLEVGE